MGMFRDMKDMMQTVRSDELKELRKKADAQPNTSMLDGVQLANAAYDDAMAMQEGGVFMILLARGWAKPLGSPEELHRYGRPANATVRGSRVRGSRRVARARPSCPSM